MAFRDSCTDASRDGEGQKRLTDPDVTALDMRVPTLADEKRADPDAPGTASDYAGTTARFRDRPQSSGFQVNATPYDAEDQIEGA